MTKKNMWQIALTGLILILGFSVNAAVAVSYNSSAPSSNVLVSYLPSSTAGYTMRNTSSRRDLGQSFQAPSNAIMKSFSYMLLGNIQGDASEASITVTVFESSSSSDIGAVVSTQTGTYLSSALNPVNPGWATFSIDDVSIEAGKYYTCMLSWTDTGATMEQVFAVNSPGEYTGGNVWQSTDGSSYTPESLDIAFSVEGVAAAVDGLAVSYDASAPSEKIVAGYTPSSPVGYTMRNTSSRRDFGQSFLAPADITMDAFSYLVAGNIQPDASLAPITVKIFESADYYQLGSVISTQTAAYLNGDLNPINPGWVIFDIEDVNLTGGKYYTCMLSWDNSGTTMEQVFAVNNPGEYADGKMWESTDGVNYASLGFDMGFRVKRATSLDSSILSWQPFSSNVFEMVVAADFPSQAYPKAITDLTSGTWGSVGHSVDGSEPFIVTNLGYSASDGTNYVIYVETDADTEFFKIDVTNPAP